jgi:hypothetical protein
MRGLLRGAHHRRDGGTGRRLRLVRRRGGRPQRIHRVVGTAGSWRCCSCGSGRRRRLATQARNRTRHRRMWLLEHPGGSSFLRDEWELTMGANDTPALACTLELHEMAPRLERLRRLAATKLQSHQLDGNVLHLAYRPEAWSEVKAVVDLERDCCRFLDFQVKEGPSTVSLTITAPEGLGPAAEWLFAQFMPAAGGKAAARPCCASCG